MAKINHEAFINSLKHDCAFHAGRFERKGRTEQQVDYVNAAAVLMSILQVLQNHASAKPLTAFDIDKARVAVFDQLGIKENRDAMGSIYYSCDPVRRHRVAPSHKEETYL